VYIELLNTGPPALVTRSNSRRELKSRGWMLADERNLEIIAVRARISCLSTRLHIVRNATGTGSVRSNDTQHTSSLSPQPPPPPPSSIYLLKYTFLRHLRNQWPWISLRGHSRSSILVPIESAYIFLLMVNSNLDAMLHRLVFIYLLK